jgi:acetyl esterase/lipase
MNAALLILAFSLHADAAPAKAFPLWPDGVPGAVGKADADQPTLTVYAPPADKANGTAVVLCPGGGYIHVALDREGRRPAEWLNQLGVTAFVLKYRLPPPRGQSRYPAQLQDGQRAIRTVRARAKEFGLDPKRIGIWGFSAGGHVASLAATHFEDGKPDAADPVEKESSRPDFLILCYPLIDMERDGAGASMCNLLLGDKPDPKLVESLSTEKQVTAQTPPTFLLHANDDFVVPAEHSVLFYLALRRSGVPAELHIYEEGNHGFALAPNHPVLRNWPDRLVVWLKGRGLLDAPEGPK